MACAHKLLERFGANEVPFEESRLPLLLLLLLLQQS